MTWNVKQSHPASAQNSIAVICVRVASAMQTVVVCSLSHFKFSPLPSFFLLMRELIQMMMTCNGVKQMVQWSSSALQGVQFGSCLTSMRKLHIFHRRKLLESPGHSAMHSSVIMFLILFHRGLRPLPPALSQGRSALLRIRLC